MLIMFLIINNYTTGDPKDRDATITIKKKLRVKGPDLVSYLTIKVGKVGKRLAGHVPLNYSCKIFIPSQSQW